ncbi:MAG: carbohydrate ABC transporter substrate-binding protein, partial [Lachnospiraceae bacterium]
MKKRVLSVLLCVGMIASLVVGCGSKSGSGDSESKSDKKLVYWSMWSEDEPQAKVIKTAIEKYQKDTGVKVDVQFKGRSGQREGLQPALDAKQNIDVFDEDVNRVNGSWGKYIMDMEDLAKDYEAEHGNETLFKIARNAYGQANGGDATL